MARRLQPKPTEATKPLPVVFDTSILRGIRPDAPPPEFRVLMRLRDSGRVVLLVPEMSAREWLSQRLESDTRAIDTLEAALNDLRKRSSITALPTKTIAKVDELLHADTLSAIRDDVNRWHKRGITQLGLSLIKLETAHLQGWLNDYFEGAPPFGAKKARNDIPDALVFASVVTTHAVDARAIFACSDGRLRSAAEARGISTAATLPDLLRNESVASLHSDPAFALWWETELENVVQAIRSHSATLAEVIGAKLENALQSSTIRDPSIPDDNCEAIVQSAEDIESVQYQWDEAESLGEGVLTVPATFRASLQLEFSVYRGDAFDVPDWVDVSIGDFEDEHYFDASGVRQGLFAARVVFEFSEAIAKKKLQISDAEISVQDTEFEDFVD